MRGEQFVEHMLGPISAEQTLLLGRMSSAETEAFRLLVRRANGVLNPVYGPRAAAATPSTASSTRSRSFATRACSTSCAPATTTSCCCTTSRPRRPHRWTTCSARSASRAPRRGSELRLPLRFFVGSARGDGLDLETPSALEVIEAAGLGIDVPEEHLEEGIARRAALDGAHRFLAVHASSGRPSNAAVAVEHRGFWFYIDARDARSKQGFLILRTLIGLRLDDASGQQSPVLTVPVGG